jgi:phage-related tail fiber protein
MANILRIKRSTTTAAPSTLQNAELAYSENSDKLFIGVGTGGAGGSATSIVAIGGKGAFVDTSTAQTVAGNKTFSGTTALGTATATTVTLSDNSTNLATTAFVKGQSYLTGNQSITLSGDATGSGSTAITVALANSGVTAGTYTKVTVDSKGRVTVGATVTATDVSNFDTQVRTSRLDQMAAPTASVAMNSQKITGLLDPTSAQDAATKAYVDAARSGLDVKQSVRAATTAAITLSGPQTVDGVVLVAGDRVLVKDQGTTSANGIYDVAAGAWTRSTDADTSAEVTAGMFCFVEEGTANGDIGFVLTTNNPITLGSTGLVFTQFSSTSSVTAGNGLTKTGTTLDVGTASTSRIVVNADDIDLATTGISAGTYKSLTIDAYGRATAGTNPTTLAGYGITDAISTSDTIDGGTF